MQSSVPSSSTTQTQPEKTAYANATHSTGVSAKVSPSRCVHNDVETCTFQSEQSPYYSEAEESIHSLGEDSIAPGDETHHELEDEDASYFFARDCDNERRENSASAEPPAAGSTEVDAPVKKHTPHRKLWGKYVFPNGWKRERNFDLRNLIAAQQLWVCPCADRINCLSADRIDVTLLYDHRRDFQLSAGRKGGKRDVLRDILAAHYSTEDGFSRSFVVGPRNDMCAATMGLACGVSVATFYNCVTDCTKGRPRHAGRCMTRNRVESRERAHLEAYIREMKASME
eukprot:1930794-Pleurochrysis_carterae.AAC.1